MIYDVGYFRRLEEELTAQEIAGRCTNGMPSLDHSADTQVDSVFKSVHAGVVNALVSSYMEQWCKGFSPSDFQMFFEGEPACPGIVPVDIDYLRIPLICEDLHVAYLNSRLAFDGKRIKRYKSKTNMLEAGAVYTPERVAHDIVRRTISNVRIDDARRMKILDFASGTGRFYRQIVSCMDEVCGISHEDAVLNNVYAVDIDPVALNICRVNALGMFDNLDADKSAIVASHIILKNALVKEELFANKEDISRKDLDGLFFNGFDAVVSNPPPIFGS